MSRKVYLSVFIALILAAGTLAPFVVESRGPVDDETATAHISDGAERPSKPKGKGNGFVRAITSPFRALGKLFGGGKKRSSDEAKGQEAAKPVAESKEEVAVVLEKRGSERAKKEESKRREKQPAVEQADAGAAPAATAELRPARQSDGVRIVRPAEGQPTQALPKSQKWVPAIEGISKDPLTQGRALLQHGHVNEAVAELSVAATVGPDLAEANNLLGLAYERLGSYAHAAEAYERALSVAPDNPRVLNNLGHSLSLAGRQADALKRLKQAERQAPGAPQILHNIALVQARMGKFGDALKSFTRAYGEYDARRKTAELLEQAGRFDEAIKHYSAALKMQPDSAPVLERLAELYDRTGRTREAQEARRALGNSPNKQKTATGGGGG